MERVTQELNLDVSKSGLDQEINLLRQQSDQNKEGLDAGLLNNDYLGDQESGLKIIGGVVSRAEVHTLKKLLFRGTRGKALLNTFFLKV